jgi:hypothetical protein
LCARPLGIRQATTPNQPRKCGACCRVAAGAAVHPAADLGALPGPQHYFQQHRHQPCYCIVGVSNQQPNTRYCHSILICKMNGRSKLSRRPHSHKNLSANTSRQAATCLHHTSRQRLHCNTILHLRSQPPALGNMHLDTQGQPFDNSGVTDPPLVLPDITHYHCNHCRRCHRHATTAAS